jgi:hypothetical protein
MVLAADSAMCKVIFGACPLKWAMLDAARRFNVSFKAVAYEVDIRGLDALATD